MTGFTLQAKEFDNWISCNYDTLVRHCKRYRIREDEMHETYLNMKNRILLSGYTGSQYMTFFKRSLRNLMINEAKKQNGKFYIGIDNEDYETTIETTLQENEEIENDTKLYREEVMFLSKMIFKYIMTEKKYEDEWQFVFRCYYLMPNRFTYAKLTEITGINKNKCTKIIQTMKNDIRTNFLEWLKQDDNRRNHINYE